MKILMLAQFYPPDLGGEERHVHTLAHALVERGHEVEVVTTALPSTGAGTTTEGGVAVTRVRTTAQRVPGLHGDAKRPHAMPVPDPAMARLIGEMLTATRYDVVHAHNWIVNSALAPAARTATPVVLTLHDYSHRCATKRLMRGGAECPGPSLLGCLGCASAHYGPVVGPVTVLANRRAAEKRDAGVAAFIAVSRAVATGNELPQSGVRYEVIPNFIPERDRDSAADHHPDGPILYVGDVSRDKGVEVLLDAYDRLRPAQKLVLVGRVSAELAGIEAPGVRVVGPVPHDQVASYYRLASLVVVPSVVRDACPTVVLEAMAAGRAVVAAASGGIVDMVADGVTGRLVAPGDGAALHDAIAQLLGDPTAATRMGRAATVHVRDFMASSVVPRIEGVYRSVISKKPVLVKGRM